MDALEYADALWAAVFRPSAETQEFYRNLDAALRETEAEEAQEDADAE